MALYNTRVRERELSGDLLYQIPDKKFEQKITLVSCLVYLGLSCVCFVLFCFVFSLCRASLWSA
jgi:hypothetical protein